MELAIKNIGKIKETNIKINGITVIAGENNTGKSTVGKVLFSLFNSMYRVDKKIEDEKKEAIGNLIYNFEKEQNKDSFKITIYPLSHYQIFIEKICAIDIEQYKSEEFIINDIEKILIEYLSNIIDNNDFQNLENSIKKLSKSIYEIIKISKSQFIKSIVEKRFNQEFNMQVNNIFSKNIGEISLKIRQEQMNITIYDNKIEEIENEFFLNKELVYIDNPFILDEINNERYSLLNKDTSSHKGHLIEKLLSKKRENIYEELIVKEKLNLIFDKINTICSGNLSYESRNVVYKIKDTDRALNIENLSTGLKTFVILKELLLNGVINENETIILDEPEIHLHPQWQLLFAELLVLIQKEFNLHILLTTHSPYFLDAIEVYSNKYEIQENCNYYLASNDDDNNAKIEDVTDNLEAIYKKLARPLQDLENERHANEF